MVLMHLTISASAYDFETDGIRYTITSLTELTVSVDGTTDADLEQLDIPQNVEYKGKSLTVTSVKEKAFKKFKNLTSVSLPSTILSIGHEAFMNDSNLQYIVLPENLSSMSMSVFENCSSLESIIIPEGLTYIGDNLFKGCSSLRSVLLNDNITGIGRYSFFGTGISELVLPISLNDIKEGAFSSSKINRIELPNLVSVIPPRCFEDCHELVSVELQANDIKDFAFKNCSALINLTLPETLKSIGQEAFYGCDSLTEFTIPAEVERIEPSIIWNCSKISKLTVGKNLRSFPVEEDHMYNPHRYFCKTIGSNYEYPGSISEEHLTGVKTLIIDDAATAFDIGSFRFGDSFYPAFANLHLEYFYVGRTLNGTKVKGAYKQPTGRIRKLEISGFCTKNPYFYQAVDTLVLGPAFKQYDPQNLYADSLKTIVCYSTTPPRIYDIGIDPDKAFPTEIYTDAMLYIPKGTKNAYSNAIGWRNFWNIEEFEDETTGIYDVGAIQGDLSLTTNNGIVIVNNARGDFTVRVFNLHGALIRETKQHIIEGLGKGIYIIPSMENLSKPPSDESYAACNLSIRF